MLSSSCGFVVFLLSTIFSRLCDPLVYLSPSNNRLEARLEAGLQEHFQAGGEYMERPSLKGLRMLVYTPTVLLVLAQGVPGCVPWSVSEI